MRIVYLCQHFPPETGAPQIRVYEVSKELLAQGHDIQVVTAFPHHPHGIIPDEYKGKNMSLKNGMEFLFIVLGFILLKKEHFINV